MAENKSGADPGPFCRCRGKGYWYEQIDGPTNLRIVDCPWGHQYEEENEAWRKFADEWMERLGKLAQDLAKLTPKTNTESNACPIPEKERKPLMYRIVTNSTGTEYRIQKRSRWRRERRAG